MMLCPQACPMSGQRVVLGADADDQRAAAERRRETRCPARRAPPSISNPRSATSAWALAQLRCSREGQFGFGVDGVRQLDQVAAAPVDGVLDGGDAVAVGILEVSHCTNVTVATGSCPLLSTRTSGRCADAPPARRPPPSATRTGVDEHDVAVVLGSGLGAGGRRARRCRRPSVPMAELPGFTPPTRGRPRRPSAVAAAGRPPGAGVPRPDPRLRGPRPAPCRASRA